MSERPPVLTAKGFENYVPHIEVLDHTPTEDSPTNHVHCDICETPEDKVVYFEDVTGFWVLTPEPPPPVGLSLCQSCLTTGLNLLNPQPPPPIKKYVMDETLSWEERYKKLEAHHVKETTWFEKEVLRLRNKTLP